MLLERKKTSVEGFYLPSHARGDPSKKDMKIIIVSIEQVASTDHLTQMPRKFYKGTYRSERGKVHCVSKTGRDSPYFFN